MITLLEPPRPPGLPSGGFRYQERVVAALGDDATRISVPPAELHDKVRELGRETPDAQVVVDGWFADLADGPLPDDVIALLHMVPARPDWSTRPLHVVVTGQRTADAVAGQAASVTVVRPGVDACFSPAPRAGDPTFAIVCAGTICEAKGQRRLVGALRGVRAPWRLTIVGSTTHAPDEVAALRQEAEGLPVDVRDAVLPEALAALYREHDVFASLSERESYGMAAAEATAAGLALFGLDVGELASFGDDDARFLLPVDASDQQLRDQLESLAARAPRRQVRPRDARTWAQAGRELLAAVTAAG